MPTISVIIPIYNVEDYLSQCLDSVLSQTHSELEVICLNDGSTDSSLSIVERYAQADSRIRVIDKPNGGYGQTVNLGFSQASGDYLAIVEPDDFIDAHMYEDLLAASRLENGTAVDIVKGAYCSFFDTDDAASGYIVHSPMTERLPQPRTGGNIHKHNQLLEFRPSIWSAIYRRTFILENEIRFIEAPGGGWVDSPWFDEVMYRAEEISWVPQEYYFYRRTNEAASAYIDGFDLPFDRLADSRAVLKRLDITDPLILKWFYRRQFNYVFSCFYGLQNIWDNPRFEARVLEIFESMDAELVEDSTLIDEGRKDLYRTLTGQGLGITATEETPLANITVLIPLRPGDCLTLGEALRSVLMQPQAFAQVLCIDCGTDGFTRTVAEAACTDERVTVLSADDDWQASISASHCFILNPSRAFKDGKLSKMTQAIQEATTDLVLFNSSAAALLSDDIIKLSSLKGNLFRYFERGMRNVVFSSSLANTIDFTTDLGLFGMKILVKLFGRDVSLSIKKLSPTCAISRQKSVSSFTSQFRSSDPSRLKTSQLAALQSFIQSTGNWDELRQAFITYARWAMVDDLLQQSKTPEFELTRGYLFEQIDSLGIAMSPDEIYQLRDMDDLFSSLVSNPLDFMIKQRKLLREQITTQQEKIATLRSERKNLQVQLKHMKQRAKKAEDMRSKTLSVRIKRKLRGTKNAD